MEVTADQRLDWDQCWDFHLPDSHPIVVEGFVLVLKECEKSHTATTTTTGSKNSQKEANSQTDNHNQCFMATKGPFFTGSWSWMKSCARHTLSKKLS